MLFSSSTPPKKNPPPFSQFHCNFVPPYYGNKYMTALFNYQKAHGLINTTGCPEGDRNGFGCPSL